jgi:hypothetical protein
MKALRVGGVALLVVALAAGAVRRAASGQSGGAEGELGGAPVAAGQAVRGPGDEAKRRRVAAAVRAMRQALRELPPGKDADQIRKSLDRIQERFVDEIQGRHTAGWARADGPQDGFAASEEVRR